MAAVIREKSASQAQNILEVSHSYTKKNRFYQFILQDMIENLFGFNLNFIYICASSIFLWLRLNSFASMIFHEFLF